MRTGRGDVEALGDARGFHNYYIHSQPGRRFRSKIPVLVTFSRISTVCNPSQHQDSVVRHGAGRLSRTVFDSAVRRTLGVVLSPSRPCRGTRCTQVAALAKPPKEMLRLPSDRLECPKVEPSQVLCPHWMLVVAHQGLRECYYIAMDMKRTLAKKMCCCCPHAKASSYKVLSEGTPVVPKRVLFVRHGKKNEIHL